YTGVLTLATNATIGVDSGSSLTIGTKNNVTGTIIDGNDEVQLVTVTGTSGTFTLKFGVATTSPLPFNATADQVEAALNALGTINGSGGSVTVLPVGSNGYLVTFGDSLAGTNQNALIPGGAAAANVVTLADGGPTSARDLTKELLGTLIFESANDYDGKTTVVQGALRVEHAFALGMTGSPTAVNATYVLNGAQLQIQTPTTGPLAGLPVVVPDEPIYLSGTGIFGTGALLNTRQPGSSTPSNNTWQ